MVLQSSGGGPYLNETFVRRRFTSPILRRLFGGILSVLGVGLGVSVLLFFVTASPLKDIEGRTVFVLWVMVLIISPYIGIFFTAWFLAGRSIWRGIALLFGTFVITAYGLFQVLNYWFVEPRPIDTNALLYFPLKQWIAMIGMVILTIVPGYLYGLGKKKLFKYAADRGANQERDAKSE